MNTENINYFNLLQYVRFPLMDSCLLSDVIKPHPIMKKWGADGMNMLMEAFEYHALGELEYIEYCSDFYL